MKQHQSDEKVQYHTGDGKWKNGVIHGVRKVDIKGKTQVLAYLIDTGGDHHIHKIDHNLKDEAHGKEFLKQVGRGLKPHEARAKAIEAADKLPDEIVTETVRQPETIDVHPDNVRPR